MSERSHRTMTAGCSLDVVETTRLKTDELAGERRYDVPAAQALAQCQMSVTFEGVPVELDSVELRRAIEGRAAEATRVHRPSWQGALRPNEVESGRHAVERGRSVVSDARRELQTASPNPELDPLM
jgi:hypothetical protein